MRIVISNSVRTLEEADQAMEVLAADAATIAKTAHLLILKW